MLLQKDENEKAVELLLYLDGAAFEFYFEPFTTDALVSEAERNFFRVKKTFLAKFSETKEPQDVICEAPDASLAKKNLVPSTDRLHALYRRA